LSKEWLSNLKSSSSSGFIYKSLQLDGYNQDTTVIPFQKPRSVTIVGSSVLQTATSPILNVDIVVGMPGECLDERDILNHAYFDKRKLYLAALAESLVRNSDLVQSCVIASFKGDTRKPVLILTPTPKKLREISVRIFLSVRPLFSLFCVLYFTPSHANLFFSTSKYVCVFRPFFWSGAFFRI
jgi:hypothetical protein